MAAIANPDFATEVRSSFERQGAMKLIRADLPVVEHGMVEIHLPHWDGVEQQHGYVHGGVIAMIADSAAGYAAMSVAPPGTSVLTVEFKLNLLSPADGDMLIARGTVLRPGRTIIVTRAEVFNVCQGEHKMCAVLQQTIMAVADRSEK